MNLDRIPVVLRISFEEDLIAFSESEKDILIVTSSIKDHGISFRNCMGKPRRASMLDITGRREQCVAATPVPLHTIPHLSRMFRSSAARRTAVSDPRGIKQLTKMSSSNAKPWVNEGRPRKGKGRKWNTNLITKDADDNLPSHT